MTIKQKQAIDKWAGYLLVFLFYPITRLFGRTFNRNHSIETSPTTILFIKILGLGSLVLAIEAMKAVKLNYPDTRIILLTDKNNADGISPFIKDIEVWKIDSSHSIHVIFHSLSYLSRLWKIKDLWVCDLEVYSKLTTIFSLFTCAINRFGFVLHPVQFRKNLNTHNIYFNNFKTYTDNYNNLASAMGAKVEELLPKRRNFNVNPSQNTIAINNTCSDLSIYRKLPEATLIEVIEWLLLTTSYSIVLCGSPKDRDNNEKLIEKLSSLSKNRIINIAEVFTFQQYYDFLAANCLFMFSIDSAPLHIARALGLPTYSVWGPTNPNSYLKILEDEKEFHLTLYQSVLCSPCVHHTKELPCKGNNFCMTEVQTERITRGLEKLVRTIVGN